jgi:protein SCO1/2
MNRRAMTKPFALSAALLLAAALPLAACDSPPAEQPPLAGAQIGGPFTLTDKTGKAVKWADFAGKWRIVYFGYTWCPDACPMDVGVMMNGLQKYAKGHAALAAEIQPIFITIDPARDTPDRVGEFAGAFGPDLLGLTGTAQQIDQAAKAFAAYYARGKDVPGGGYLMDHSRIAYLMDRTGQPVSMLPVDKGPDAVAADLAKWVR